MALKRNFVATIESFSIRMAMSRPIEVCTCKLSTGHFWIVTDLNWHFRKLMTDTLQEDFSKIEMRNIVDTVVKYKLPIRWRWELKKWNERIMPQVTPLPWVDDVPKQATSEDLKRIADALDYLQSKELDLEEQDINNV